MRRFLICGGLCGDEQALKRLGRALDEHRPEAVLFVGGVLSPATGSGRNELSAADARFYAQFYDTIGESETFSAVIPGPDDAPLRDFLRLGMNAEVESPLVHVVHATVTGGDDLAICGIGGELTEKHDSGEGRIRQSRNIAEYFLRNLAAAKKSRKILLLASPPAGELGGLGESGTVAGELIDSYHPHVCAVAGDSAHRGMQRVAHTTIVNPGRLADGCAAWFDWSRDRNQQVTMLELGEAAVSRRV